MELCWSGPALWFKAVHRHLPLPPADGGTRYTIVESLAGIFGTILMNSQQLQKQHEQWLSAFKAASGGKDQ